MSTATLPKLDRKAVLGPETKDRIVYTNSKNIEPRYRESLETLTMESHDTVTNLIIANPKKPGCYHAVVSQLQMEFDQFKSKVWDKDLKGARLEHLDFINKAKKAFVLTDHLTEID